MLLCNERHHKTFSSVFITLFFILFSIFYIVLFIYLFSFISLLFITIYYIARWKNIFDFPIYVKSVSLFPSFFSSDFIFQTEVHVHRGRALRRRDKALGLESLRSAGPWQLVADGLVTKISSSKSMIFSFLIMMNCDWHLLLLQKPAGPLRRHVLD